MLDFIFSIPQNIIFGKSSLKKLPSILKNLPSGKIMILSGRRLEAIGTVKKVTDLLDEEGIKHIEFLDIEANPSVETVNAAAKAYLDNKAAGIIALGGGSPMDVAKSVGILAVYGGDITQYEGGGKVPGKIAPIIAIPTTAGTGSEVTAFSVITDRTRNYKLTIFSNELIPVYALLDPDLIMSLPADIAAATGMDALVHGIESYLSKVASPFSDAMAEYAIKMIGRNIRRFVADRSDEEAACSMLLASTFAGIAFNWARLGNVHAMAHPLGGYFNIPHGIANAILLPVVLEYNALVDNGKYEIIYNLLKTGKDKIYQDPYTLVEEVKKLLKELQIPEKLSSVGVTENKFKAMSADAMKSGNIAVNPRKTEIKDIEMLYKKAL
ncbi:iron-containing alcohol dehydrogenase [Anaerocolumna sedimenticola]|uniref:Iron-containing alcohol dehydrogenase n=1 Tax=Anaerocolumna sedimenticola TaxID=2696063 RepID=A0A6P1TFA6_9FIRM|nr:iron-containing alcohol dehydrogenase [Anaerocolumna sedimenticola]QHQ59834.1 iron-containing alcohol dehydrogenase [Anaerocolumna sedimenticola]